MRWFLSGILCLSLLAAAPCVCARPGAQVPAPKKATVRKAAATPPAQRRTAVKRPARASAERPLWFGKGVFLHDIPPSALSPQPTWQTPGSVDTSAGINSALNAAEGRRRRKSGVGMSVREQSASWRGGPNAASALDEHLPLESKHVLRAYARMEAGDDFSIRVGPELILKNERREPGALPDSDSQPASALGLGMHFKLDF